MMKKEMCIDSASPKTQMGTDKESQMSADALTYEERLLSYKKFAVAFSYPDGEFFTFFPEQKGKKEELLSEYDRLFRANNLWLYTAEYTAENEFQRANNLADINGFYRAFGLEVDNDRPDHLPCTLEFMHYLIFKEINAPDGKKARICFEAQKKFFNEHLCPAVKKLVQIISSQIGGSFYKKVAHNLFDFFEDEKIFRKN